MFKKKRTPAAEPVAADTKPAEPDKPIRVPRLRAGTYSSTKTNTRPATRLSTGTRGTTDKGA